MSRPDFQPSREKLLHDLEGCRLDPVMIARLDLNPCIRIGTATIGQVPGHTQASVITSDRLSWMARQLWSGAHYRGPEDFSFSLS